MLEEDELNNSFLTKPIIREGLDLSLFTRMENSQLAKSQVEHEKIFRKRAEELRFYPDVLSEKERYIILRCMTYNELKPCYQIGAILEKNKRLQKCLSLDEKIDIRIYCIITKHFSELGPVFKEGPQDVDIGVFTERYFEIMRKYEERVYEEPYYFLNEEHKKRVLKAYAEFDSEEKNSEFEPEPLIGQVLEKIEDGGVQLRKKR